MKGPVKLPQGIWLSAASPNIAVLKNLFREFFQSYFADARGSNGHVGRIVTGPKGCGKTTLLQATAVTCCAIFPNVYYLYVNCSGRSQLGDYRPLTLISQLINQVPPASDVCQLTIPKNSYCFLIYDEFQEEYRDTTYGLNVITDFYFLAHNRTARVFPVIAGSGAALRCLCFSRNGSALRDLYHLASEAINLNSTRFCAVSMSPLCGKDPFRRYLEYVASYESTDLAADPSSSLSNDSESEVASQAYDMALEDDFINSEMKRSALNCLQDPALMQRVYVANSGVFRAIQNCLKDPDVGLTEAVTETTRTWAANEFVQAVWDLLCANTMHKQMDAPWTLDSVSESALKNLMNLHEHSWADVYKLADERAFIISTSGHACTLLTFYSPVHYIYANRRI